ncbi:hypothetical protein [Luteolibacter sp. LG18]|uniref:hypothetical protein n=1 Tax=Luteolibacter sp. LG18 TaxID=2819286 RepID=UPI002B30CD07|nr:hypothetical protein llg_06960 [Luteolibacter sp. LG18]BCU79675.1 hypothetical protein llg_43900 [Luteolibacter sp. LG18]
MPEHVTNCRITWDPDGRALVLLDFGEHLIDDMQFGGEQGFSPFGPLGAKNAVPYANGEIVEPHTWTRRRTHASRLAAQLYCHVHPQTLPYLSDRKVLRYEYQDGAVVDYQDAVLLAAPTRQCFPAANETTTIYKAVSGEMIPMSGVPFTPGMTWRWLDMAWEDIPGTWEDM